MTLEFHGAFGTYAVPEGEGIVGYAGGGRKTQSARDLSDQRIYSSRSSTLNSSRPSRVSRLGSPSIVREETLTKGSYTNAYAPPRPTSVLLEEYSTRRSNRGGPQRENVVEEIISSTETNQIFSAPPTLDRRKGVRNEGFDSVDGPSRATPVNEGVIKVTTSRNVQSVPRSSQNGDFIIPNHVNNTQSAPRSKRRTPVTEQINFNVVNSVQSTPGYPSRQTPVNEQMSPRYYSPTQSGRPNSRQDDPNHPYILRIKIGVSSHPLTPSGTIPRDRAIPAGNLQSIPVQNGLVHEPVVVPRNLDTVDSAGNRLFIDWLMIGYLYVIGSLLVIPYMVWYFFTSIGK